MQSEADAKMVDLPAEGEATEVNIDEAPKKVNTDDTSTEVDVGVKEGATSEEVDDYYKYKVIGICDKRIKKEYTKSKANFISIKNGYKIKEKNINFEYLSNSVKHKYTSNEWEIPKGRRNNLETNKQCAKEWENLNI